MIIFHREKLIGHTAAIMEEIPAMVCGALQSSKHLRIAWKSLVSSHRAAGPFVRDICKSCIK